MLSAPVTRHPRQQPRRRRLSLLGLTVALVSALLLVASPAGVWAAPVDEDPNDSLRPQAASDSQGNLHVVWHNSGSGGGESVRYARGTRAADGTYSWSDGEDVYRPGGNFNYVYPRLTVDRQDQVHAVWTWGNRILYSRWPAAAGPSQKTEPLQLGTGVYPAVTGDPTNTNIHVIWETSDGYGNFEIVYREFTGQGFTSPINISELESDSLHPDLAVDTKGQLNIVWQDGSKILYKRRIGTTWQQRVTVSESFSYFPSIVADNAGCVHMGWVSLGGVNKAVYRKACDGQFVDTKELGDATNPRAAVGTTAGGRALLAWDSKSGGVDGIFSSQIFNGTATSAQRLSPSGARQFWPDVVSTPDGKLVVLWQEEAANKLFDPSYLVVNPCGTQSTELQPEQQPVPVPAPEVSPAQFAFPLKIYLPVIDDAPQNLLPPPPSC